MKIYRYCITTEGKVGKPADKEKEAGNRPTVDFCENENGGMTLLRWPRLAETAVLPEMLEGRKLTAIAATAFAPEHLPEELFKQMYDSVVGYSMFCMKMGKYLSVETMDEGGPISIYIPRSVESIGEYAFWRCRNLKEIDIPDAVRELPAGVFGECVNLERVHLSKELRKIGYMPSATQQVMPDAGVFAGCHNLKKLILPGKITLLGAQSFNSAGLKCLALIKTEKKRVIKVDETAFSHTASLLWLDKTDEGGTIKYRIGLPVAMDKILSDDVRFGVIKKIPGNFFIKPAEYFDELARSAFRLDFSARMALSRLVYDEGLSDENREWYLNLLVEYYGNAKQFMPTEKDAYEALFDFLKKCRELTAMHMSSLLRTAGRLHLPAKLISEMMEIRCSRFRTVTGFEELELDGFE